MSAVDNCPFCGWRSDVVRITGLYYVECTDCGAEGPVEETEAEAIAMWNRRASRPAVQQEGLTVCVAHWNAHEDTGDFGYYFTEEEARAALAEAQKTRHIGGATETGDFYQYFGVAPITIKHRAAPPAAACAKDDK